MRPRAATQTTRLQMKHNGIDSSFVQPFSPVFFLLSISVLASTLCALLLALHRCFAPPSTAPHLTFTRTYCISGSNERDELPFVAKCNAQYTRAHTHTHGTVAQHIGPNRTQRIDKGKTYITRLLDSGSIHEHLAAPTHTGRQKDIARSA